MDQTQAMIAQFAQSNPAMYQQMLASQLHGGPGNTAGWGQQHPQPLNPMQQAMPQPGGQQPGSQPMMPGS